MSEPASDAARRTDQSDGRTAEAERGGTVRHCVEYYNDQEECLAEYRRQKRIDEEANSQREEEQRRLRLNRATIAKKMLLRRQQPSEESTDQESNYPAVDCHQCFLENYAYELTKAYFAEAQSCRFCDVVQEMLAPPKRLPDRSYSSPAILDKKLFKSGAQDREQCWTLAAPVSKDRRKSAGPLRFLNQDSPTDERTMTVSIVNDNSKQTSTDLEEGAIARRWGSTRKVEIRRKPDSPLGVSIVGGKVDQISNNGELTKDGIVGIFIKNVVPESPAGLSGLLHIGDRILEVDGVCVRSAPHEKAVQLIRATGDIVSLTVQSLLAWNTDVSDDQADSSSEPLPVQVKKNRAPQPPTSDIQITVTNESEETKHFQEETDTAVGENVMPTTDAASPETKKEKVVYSDDEESDDEDEDEEDRRDLEGRTYSEAGVEIDRASAAAVKRTKEEKEADPEAEDTFGYTTNKIRKKYANLGHQVIAVRLERGPKGGLGISLAGHRDRSCMAVFVCGLHPSGAAVKAQPSILVGDEILEVNGIVLHGRCHLNASAIIKGLAGPVFKVVLLRRKQALEDVAVKPLTHFPISLDEDNSEDRYSSYRGVRTVTIKKGTQSLGIMIIEGRHADVGQGIFISNIQEGSPAEAAGLAIGDMILAVNKDSLLGTNYDSAASLLKRTEGVVVLTVCNPNKKEDTVSVTSDKIDVKQPSRPSSRTATPDPKTLQAKGPSRPQTPGVKSAASPAKDPIADPTTAAIVPGRDTVIEVNTDNKTLGINIIGGKDTLLPEGIVVLEVYPDGVVGKDGRLQPGDQILECNGVPITKEMTHERACLTIKQTAPKLRLTVFRPETIAYTNVEVELARKPGKGFGLGIMARKPPPGVYLADILAGGAADIDGRLQRGDLLHAVDGKDVSNATSDECAAALKCIAGKGVIKVRRYKVVR